MLRWIVASCCVAMACPQAAMSEDKDPIMAPLAFVAFCSKMPAECERRGSVLAEVEITPPLRETLHAVNRSVNADIQPDESVSNVAGTQDWSISPARGDCNDYAVTKRHALISRGLPTSAVRLAAVVTADGQDHMIVVVKAKGGDLVLDNLIPDVVPLSRTGYLLVKEQSGPDPKVWVKPD